MFLCDNVEKTGKQTNSDVVRVADFIELVPVFYKDNFNAKPLRCTTVASRQLTPSLCTNISLNISVANFIPPAKNASKKGYTLLECSNNFCKHCTICYLYRGKEKLLSIKSYACDKSNWGPSVTEKQIKMVSVKTNKDNKQLC